MGELIDKAKGKIKQAAGEATDDDKLKAEGKVDEMKGKVKGVVEDVKHVVKDAVRTHQENNQAKQADRR